MINNIISKNIIDANINDDIKYIANLMKINNIGFIPIKENNNYVGIITDRDICLSLPTIKSLNDSIKPYISKNIIYIDYNSPIDDALKLMKKYRIKRLLVKNKDNTIGVLSLSDILNYTDDNKLITTYKTIFNVGENNNYIEAEIDEFYL